MLTFGTNQSGVLTGVNHTAPHAGVAFTLLTFIDRQTDRPISRKITRFSRCLSDDWLYHPRGNHPSSEFFDPIFKECLKYAR